MTELYLGVMDALWEMTPDAPIFFINGGGQGAYAVSTNSLHTRLAAAPSSFNSVGWQGVRASGAHTVGAGVLAMQCRLACCT